MNNKSKSLLAEHANALFEPEKGSAESAHSHRPRLQTGPSRRDLEVAFTVMLVDLASCDQKFEPAEYQIIAGGLRRLFGTKKDEVSGLVNQALMVLSNLRGTSQFAKLLAEHLDDEQKQAMAEILDQLVLSDGEICGHERYLHNRAVALLRLPPDKE